MTNTEHDQSKLNDDLNIVLDPEYREKLLDMQRQRMGSGKKREGTHVSDLIMCIRKSWVEKWTDYVFNPPDKTILTWMRGLSHENMMAETMQSVRVWYCFVCDAMTSNLEHEASRCTFCNETLMVGTIDWVTIEGEELDYSPVEMKSTMKSARKDLNQMAWYADQVKTYMAMHKKNKGRIGVLHVVGDYRRSDPDERSDGPDVQFFVYRLEWKNEEGARRIWLNQLWRRKTKLENPDKMPDLDEDSPGRHPFICNFCEVGEKLPNGEECEKFPYRKLQDGTYVIKESDKRDISIEDMLSELKSMSEEASND